MQKQIITLGSVKPERQIQDSYMVYAGGVFALAYGPVIGRMQ